MYTDADVHAVNTHIVYMFYTIFTLFVHAYTGASASFGHRGSTLHLFRHTHTLNVDLAPEPDTINWLNIEIYGNKLWVCFIISYILFISILIIALYFIYLTALYIPSLLSLVITILDLCLYYIIVYITYYEYKHTESSRLQSLHQKLFIENLSITAIFAYCITPYGALLSQTVISNIILIQISTCILLPLVR